MPAHTVAVLAFDGISPFHLAVPCAVFGSDCNTGGVQRIRLLVCSIEKGPLQTNAGFAMQTEHGLDAMLSADTIIVPSWNSPHDEPPPLLLAALRQAHARGAQIVGLCLGAFVLAAAGLLDQRTATTHWLCTDELARRYPRVQVNPKVLYVADGKVLTSAGTAAGIDCCLHILRQQCGAEIANHVARRMIVPPHRQGSQAQYIERPLLASPGSERFMEVIEWAGQNLRVTHSLDSLAEKSLMSRRSFTRRFKQATGTTVNLWLRHQRLALAQRFLETTDQSIEVIAELAGFGSTLSLRQHFNQLLNTSPSVYRREFRGY